MQRRIDMLPKPLTEDICSLREDVERLAFSVLWEITEDARIICVRFTKSVIKCATVSSVLTPLPVSSPSKRLVLELWGPPEWAPTNVTIAEVLAKQMSSMAVELQPPRCLHCAYYAC